MYNHNKGGLYSLSVLKPLFSLKINILNYFKPPPPLRGGGGEYPSIVETAKSIGCGEKTIIRALKTEKKLLKKRWIVKYK